MPRRTRPGRSPASSGPSSRAAEQGGSAGAAILSWSVNGDTPAPHLRAKAAINDHDHDHDLTKQLGITIAKSSDGPEEKAAASAARDEPDGALCGLPCGVPRWRPGVPGWRGGADCWDDTWQGRRKGCEGCSAAPGTGGAAMKEEGGVSEPAPEDLGMLSKQELIAKVWRAALKSECKMLFAKQKLIAKIWWPTSVAMLGPTYECHFSFLSCTICCCSCCPSALHSDQLPRPAP